VALVEIDGHKSEPVRSFTNKIYQVMKRNSIEIILDDRNAKLGSKLHDWELMGIPNIAIVGKKEAENNIVTFKRRNGSEKQSLGIDQLISKIGKD
jgi:threonyl-tRNA synthetase